MPEQLPFHPEQPSHRYTMPLDGVQYDIRLTYRERTSSWYLDLWDENGRPLVLGRRLSPNWGPTVGVLTAGPPGKLFVFGEDPYARDEIELWYFTAAELAAEPDPNVSTLRVVLA
jgi:uncharacterized protein DUF6983